MTFFWCETGSGLGGGSIPCYFRCSWVVVIASCFSPTSTGCLFSNVHGSCLKMPCDTKFLQIGDLFSVSRKLIFFAIRTDGFFLVGINFCDLQKVPDKSLIIIWFLLPVVRAMCLPYLKPCQKSNVSGDQPNLVKFIKSSTSGSVTFVWMSSDRPTRSTRLLQTNTTSKDHFRDKLQGRIQDFF